MGAKIGDGIVLTIDVKDHNGFFLELDPEARTGRNVGCMGYLYEDCHGKNESGTTEI